MSDGSVKVYLQRGKYSKWHYLQLLASAWKSLTHETWMLMLFIRCSSPVTAHTTQNKIKKSMQLTEYQYMTPNSTMLHRHRKWKAVHTEKITCIHTGVRSGCKVMHGIINLPLRLDRCCRPDADDQAIIASGVAFTALPHYWNRC